MANQQTIEAEKWRHRTLLDRDDEKIGKIADVYFDTASGAPEWVLVHTGLFGIRETVVPVHRARPRGDDVCVPYVKSFVKGAPNVDTDQELSEAEDRAVVVLRRGIPRAQHRPTPT